MIYVAKVLINDKDALFNIFKVISWLDNQRWKEIQNYNLLNYYKDDLTNSEKILTHWICYITDRQMSFKKVWEDGGLVFSELVHNFFVADKSVDELLAQFYKKRPKNDKKFEFKSIISQRRFVSRYITSDYNSIKQTLKVLDEKEYNRNIIVYIAKLLERFKNKDDLLVRVACGLYLLTYGFGKNSSPQKVIETLNSDEKFETQLKKFKKESTKGKKRLWCCIRDYKKGEYHIIFKNAIKEVLYPKNAKEIIGIWDSLPMDQIELPGDVWNNNPLLKERLFYNVLDLSNVPKGWKMPEIIRDIYNQTKDELKERGINFYPEQFDITFDFVPRMCTKKLCKVCPFGKTGFESICTPNKGKYCPVALATCGYLVKCPGKEKCPIVSNIGKGICKTEL